LTTIQVAALEYFLVHHSFEYIGYNQKAGTVIYRFNLNNWRMGIEFGDECYYYLDNEVTKVSIRQKFTKVCEVMLAYEQIWNVAEDERYA